MTIEKKELVFFGGEIPIGYTIPSGLFLNHIHKATLDELHRSCIYIYAYIYAYMHMHIYTIKEKETIILKGGKG